MFRGILIIGLVLVNRIILNINYYNCRLCKIACDFYVFFTNGHFILLKRVESLGLMD